MDIVDTIFTRRSQRSFGNKIIQRKERAMGVNQNEDQEQEQELHEERDQNQDLDDAAKEKLDRGLRILARMIARAHLEENLFNK